MHFNLPYKWEVNEGDGWRDLRGMEEIERAFCDPKNAFGSVNTHKDTQTLSFLLQVIFVF